MSGVPFPDGRLFQIHGGNFKLSPSLLPGQGLFCVVTHPVLFLSHRQTHAQYFFFRSRYSSLYTAMCRICYCHLHIVLPDMAQHSFFALGVFGAHSSGGTSFAKIRPGFCIPGSRPGLWWNKCSAWYSGQITSSKYRRTHMPTRDGCSLCFWVWYSRWKKNRTAFKRILLADPGCFVGAVRHHRFVFGIVLVHG